MNAALISAGWALSGPCAGGYRARQVSAKALTGTLRVATAAFRGEGLVARLVADTDSGDALPLRAYPLAQLANGVGHGGRLLTSRYEQLSRVQGALARQAAFADATAANGRSRDEVITEQAAAEWAQVDHLPDRLWEGGQLGRRS